MLAGIDLLTGRVHALVKLILDNHSAHISKETKAWLASQPAGRFEFVFTPKHGSWLNLVEGFFSKLARSVLRHIRVASKQELKDRPTALAGLDYQAMPSRGHSVTDETLAFTPVTRFSSAEARS